MFSRFAGLGIGNASARAAVTESIEHSSIYDILPPKPQDTMNSEADNPLTDSQSKKFPYGDISELADKSDSDSDSGSDSSESDNEFDDLFDEDDE